MEPVFPSFSPPLGFRNGRKGEKGGQPGSEDLHAPERQKKRLSPFVCARFVRTVEEEALFNSG